MDRPVALQWSPPRCRLQGGTLSATPNSAPKYGGPYSPKPVDGRGEQGIQLARLDAGLMRSDH